MDDKVLVSRIADRCGVDLNTVNTVKSELLGAVREALARCEQVELQGLGRFTFVMAAEGSHLVFLPSDLLKDQLPHSVLTGVLPEGALERTAPEHAPARPSGSISATATPLRPRKAKARQAPEDDAAVADFARDLLGMDDLDTGTHEIVGQGLLNLAAIQGTFSLQVNPQDEDVYRPRKPETEEERILCKELFLQSFFLMLGSVVRDRQTHEPLIVYDVKEIPHPEGETYEIICLRIRKRVTPSEAQNLYGLSGPGLPFIFENVPFDHEKHDVGMIVDHARSGPKAQAFEIGTFFQTDRRQKSEVFLAMEYERFQADYEIEE